jgi:IS5 family transposase
LRVRIHLGLYILQQLYNLTDRQAEYALHDNAAFRLFCGYGCVKPWHVPDHTKIEEFRSRLQPETQRTLANQLAVYAVKLKIAHPAQFDIDSTVQEAKRQA